jgi:hypothetical protein
MNIHWKSTSIEVFFGMRAKGVLWIEKERISEDEIITNTASSVSELVKHTQFTR